MQTMTLDQTQQRHFPAGHAIFLEGDRSHTVYQVTAGVVKLTRIASSGREIIVGLAFPGDVLDVVAVLDGKTHGVTATALAGNDVEVCCLPRERALANPALVRRLESACVSELREQRDRTVAIAVERVETRALSALTGLARRLGEPLGRCLRLRFLLNRQEFAELIGATTETAIRVLSQFRRQGLIREESGWMTLSEAACGAA